MIGAMFFLLVVSLACLLIAAIEVTKYDELILSFGRYMTYSLLACSFLCLTVYLMVGGLFHPLVFVLFSVSGAILIQSFHPVKAGITSRLYAFKKWIKGKKHGH